MLLSNAENGQLVAILDAAAVTWLRTGAAAVLAAETVGRPDAETAAVVGAGVNGSAAARTFIARGQAVSLYRHRSKPCGGRGERARSGRRCVARRRALGGSRRDGDPRLRAGDRGGHAPPWAARLADGRRRPRQGGDRRRRARAHARLLRRLGAGEPQRRARARGRGRRARAATTSPTSAPSSPATRPAAARTTRSPSSTRPASRSMTLRSRSPRSSGRTTSTCRRSTSRQPAWTGYCSTA